jgi:hypothetical protein
VEKKLVAKLPPASSEPGKNSTQYNTVEINRAFDEMTIPDNSLPSLDGPHTQMEGEVLQEGCLVPHVEGNGVAVRGSSRIPESDELAEQETLPMDQLERSSR